MKKSIVSLLCTFAFATLAMAQGKVTTLDLEGKKYTVTRDMPADMKAHILGKYLCNTKSGNPIVELKADGTGLFQRHDVPADNIEFWIDCDEKGAIRKQTGPTGNYGITVVYKCIGGKLDGQYDLMGVVVALDGFGTPITNRPEIKGGYAAIYGERYKPLN